MIEQLRISGLGVIDEAVVNPGPGLTVLTGETGAGKTMVLTGLDLILGGKSDASLLRKDHEALVVEARFLVRDTGNSPVARICDELGADLEPAGKGDAELIITRSVNANGRSRGVIGGVGVPARTMSEVGENLVHVHGQAEQQRLREEVWQRSLVDRFGGKTIDQALSEFQQQRKEWRSARDRLERWRGERARAAEMQHVWSRGLAEIEAADPRTDELSELDTLAAVLGNAESLTEHAREAAVAIAAEEVGEAGALTTLNGVIRQLEAIVALDSRMHSLLERVRSITAELADVRAEITSYERTVESDPQRYAQVEERRRLLSGLMKSYGPELSDVLAWAEQARAGLAEITDEAGAELTDAEERSREAMVRAAVKLSELRREAAAGLAQAVAHELDALALPDAELSIEVNSSDQADSMRGHGADQVAINFRAHPDAPWRPLAKAASGGELSRLALAIEVVLVAGEQQPTLIFDEVDAGIGGSVAVEVGRRLSRLAAHAQVIVVTHLPQVAAFADTHLVVERATDGDTGRRTHVTEVHGEQRVTELVRMLSGLSVSDSGAAHARELLGVAGKAI